MGGNIRSHFLLSCHSISELTNSIVKNICLVSVNNKRGGVQCHLLICFCLLGLRRLFFLWFKQKPGERKFLFSFSGPFVVVDGF